MAKKETKYLVMKIADVENFFTETEQEILECLMAKLGNNHKYIICNQDEPYSEKVWNVILNGEDAKAQENKDDV